MNRVHPRRRLRQNGVDLFVGKWASDLGKVRPVTETGTADLFTGDPRPAMVASALGDGTGRLNGMRVLELGPLEAGHSYQLEQLGAEARHVPVFGKLISF